MNTTNTPKANITRMRNDQMNDINNSEGTIFHRNVSEMSGYRLLPVVTVDLSTDQS